MSIPDPWIKQMGSAGSPGPRGFGSCTDHAECEAVCPKLIPLEFIARLKRDVLRAILRPHREPLAVREAPAASHQD